MSPLEALGANVFGAILLLALGIGVPYLILSALYHYWDRE